MLSMGRSADCLVCRPCRQDITRVVGDPCYTPRWERENATSQCCVVNCAEFAFTHGTVTTDVCQEFAADPPPSPTPLCKHHYHVLYDRAQTRQRNCRTCGRRLQAGSDRPCPQPNVVQEYLKEHADFTGDISKSDRVCFTCYKSHLALLKQNIPTSDDEDLKAQVQSVRASVDKGSDIVHDATNRMLLDVWTMLLDNRASLLPIICANFHRYAKQLAVAKGIEEPAELKLVTSRRILCEIKAKYQHHVAYTCKVQMYGTLVYRPTSDMHTILTEALWKIRTKGVDRDEVHHEPITSLPDSENLNICDMNSLIHAQIESYISGRSGVDHDYDKLNMEDEIAGINPKLWNAIRCMTRSNQKLMADLK